MTNAYDEYVANLAKSMEDMEKKLQSCAKADPEGMKEIAGRLLDEIKPGSGLKRSSNHLS